MNYKYNIKARKQALIKLLDVILKHEDEIIGALYYDFKKPAFETIATEIGYVISELKYAIKNIEKWSKIKRVMPWLINFPSTDYIVSEPYGKVLIISPWNYPFQLALCPVISAVAAGNTVVLKPSELAPKTSEIVLKIIDKAFEPQHVLAIDGGAEAAQHLLQQRWDYIFFTGSLSVGKQVALAAAQQLCPLTLELGGKNPCIIDQTANLKLAAKRIVWGKFLNAGQTCIAPDYVLIEENMKNHFVDYLKKEITKAYGSNPKQSPDFARIINDKHCYRLMSLIEPKKVLFGGETDIDSRYIAPTLIEEDNLDSALMSEEIFGPILPIITYTNDRDIEQIISKFEKPLALYVFTEDRKFARKTVTKYSFGGGCVNDTLSHFANKRLPFGGVGHSGLGATHGKFGFNSFTHQKGIIKKANWLDIQFRYAPYSKKLTTLRNLIKWF